MVDLVDAYLTVVSSLELLGDLGEVWSGRARFEHAEAQALHRSAAVLEHGGELVVRDAGLLQEALPEGREGDPAAGPVQQLRAQLAFQPAQALADM